MADQNKKPAGTTVIRPTNPLHLLPTPKLSLGCPKLDRFLSGGLPVSSLTELSGESATGKTQLCLQLLLTSLLPTHLGGLSAASLLLTSSSSAPLLRRLRHLPFPPHLLPPNSKSPLDHIYVSSANSPSELLALLTRASSVLAEPPPNSLPIRLLVVDSIAALFRAEFDNKASELKKRASLFFQVAARLKELAWRFRCAVVVTNQVVDVVEGNGEESVSAMSLWSSGRRVAPALGLSWANCVNTRLFLSRDEEAVGEMGGEVVTRTRRRMRVVFAPHMPEMACEFVIRKHGVFGVETAVER